MRVIAGQAKGIRLSSLKGIKIRPTSDRVKEAIFSIISEKLEMAMCLDLYAGTGALGIEALSRGAKNCVFIDNNSQSVKLIKKNLEKTDLIKKSKVIKCQVNYYIKEAAKKKERYHLIFLDPPYKIKTSIIEKVITKLFELNFVLPEGRLIVEHSSGVDLTAIAGHFINIDSRHYGDTAVSFLESKES